VDLVTETDKAAERAIIDLLRASHPVRRPGLGLSGVGGREGGRPSGLAGALPACLAVSPNEE